MKLTTAGSADYLIVAASREILFRLFYERGNEPLEFSALRIALEAHGVKAEDPNHWGSLAASLKESGVLELVGRQQALVASRNGARNGVYRLTPDMWRYVENILAPSRGWKPNPTVPMSEPQVLAL